MAEITPCDVCDKIAGIHICTKCYEKATARSSIDAMKTAVKILESRQATAKALTYEEDYLAAYEDALIFLKAELSRMERPDHAGNYTTLD